MNQNSPRLRFQIILLALLAILMANCNSSTPEWKKKNAELIQKYGLKETLLNGLPKTQIESNLEPAIITNLNNVESIDLHAGVQAKILWGSGVMLTELLLEPQAQIPEKTVDGDRFVFVIEGETAVKINGTTSAMISRNRENPDGIHSQTPRIDFVFVENGSKISLKAGDIGARIFEISSPVQIDYLQKSGIKPIPTQIDDIQNTLTPNIQPSRIYDLYDIQLTKLTPKVFSRLISGRNMMLSFLSIDPETISEHHIHPEEQITVVLRGSVESMLLDNKKLMETDDVVRIPGNLVHGASIGELGAHALDIFWPSRTDYLEKEKETMQVFHEFIPKEAELELVIDGKKSNPELYFTEGPKWMNGKLYFSNMYFDKDYNADPKRSSTVVMDPDGSYRNISQGKMQTNGLYPYKNGNLLVCDMMGHRVVEMSPNGQILRVLVEEYQGKPIDGPNDIITDSKGGFYFTDPQFTMEAEKFQPGRAVYYVSPKGEISRITKPNEFAMPNGILLSPDGKTLYINNCFDKEDWYPVQSEKENYIWAYDVNEDGSISNGRQFAKVFLTEDVLERKGRSSGADGMAIDKEGNIYVATYYGVQIFDNTGKFVGMINMPSFPVSLAFGDEDMKTLYIVSYSKVYKIRTNKEGYVNYL